MRFPKSSELERELVVRLRELASGSARAMAATVVVASDEKRAETADAVVDRLMGRRPARVIHLRSGADQAFRASSSARCALDRQSRGVCFEDIYLESADDSAVEPRVWSPFVIRELPALLFWNFGPASLSKRGVDCADRVDLVMVDGSVDLALAGRSSGTFAFPAELSPPLRAYARESLKVSNMIPAYLDLAWERLEPMRVAAARLFDGAEGPARFLTTESIEVRARDEWSGALIAGWLLARFNAVTAEEGREKRLDVNVSIGEPFIRFSFGDGRVASLRFEGARLSVLRFDEEPENEIGFPEPNDGAILARIVDTPLGDPLYLDALVLVG